MATLPCPPRGQGSIWIGAQIWRTTHKSGAPNPLLAAPARTTILSWHTNFFCPALREGRAASYAPKQFLAHQFLILAHQFLILAAPRQFLAHQLFLPCSWRGQGSISRTKAAPNSHKAAPRRTNRPHHAPIFCPALHKGRAASWEQLLMGRKFKLKPHFNSFLHQIKSPSKSQNPRIESV